MDGPGGSGLTGRERQILAQIEADLKADAALDHSLSRMRTDRWRYLWQRLCAVRVSAVVFLGAASLGLLGVALQSPVTGVLLVSALLWTVTLAALAGLTGRLLPPALRRRRALRQRDDG
ncbi:DUF3040 domain-containing protein [Kitasatospora sp. NPDC052896]|uniref:DUF3040 domain-containing protein n=1 Tax=Kitasatospora sp. NPDC052896 TaxID=3364061 RepID=UPI0037C8BE88